MDNILDHVVVQGQSYDIVSPTAFGDYIETIGSACINPDGYAQGSTFLAKFGNEQFYYEATAAITQGSAISEGTNCKRTTVTGREAELALEIENLGDNVSSLSEALTNVKDDLASISITGATNNTGSTIASGTFFYLNGVLVRAKTDIADGATLTLNTNYEAVTAGGFNALASSIRLDFQNFGNISSIKTYIEALPGKTVDVKSFYTKPSDAPTGLGNWSYTLVTFKKEDGSSIARTYCLLFYPGKLYVGNLSDGVLTWNEITLS